MICDMIVFHKIMTIPRRIFVVECQCLHFTNGDRVIPLILPFSCQKSAKETDIINLADVECHKTGWSNSILVGRDLGALVGTVVAGRRHEDDGGGGGFAGGKA